MHEWYCADKADTSKLCAHWVAHASHKKAMDEWKANRDSNFEASRAASRQDAAPKAIKGDGESILPPKVDALTPQGIVESLLSSLPREKALRVAQGVVRILSGDVTTLPPPRGAATSGGSEFERSSRHARAAAASASASAKSSLPPPPPMPPRPFENGRPDPKEFEDMHRGWCNLEGNQDSHPCQLFIRRKGEL